MNEQLRSYLEKIGLRSEATEAEAWQYLQGLHGTERSQAYAIALGDDPPSAPPVATPASAQRQAEPVAPPEPVVATLRTTAPPPVDQDAIRRQAIDAERTRVRELQELAGEDVPAEMVQRAITEGWDTERAGREFLTAIRAERSQAISAGPAVHSHDHDADCNARTLGAALVIRTGIDPTNDQFMRALAQDSERSIDSIRVEWERAANIGHQFRDLSFVDICREACRMDTGRIPRSTADMLRAATSGASMTNIFTTSVNAQLLMSYMSSPDTTAGWVREVDVPNFLQNERILLGKTATLDKLARGDTAQHTTRADSQETYKIARYAKQFVVDEQDIIDDRLNAIMDMPMEMGDAAAQLRPDLVYAILLANAALVADSVVLFHAASHSNLQTSAALAAATLQTAITDMGVQQQDGRNLGVFPAFLLVPRGLKHTASQLIRSAEIRPAGDTDTTVGTYNPIRDDNLSMRSDSRLDNGVTDPATGTAYSGSSTTWYLAARGGRHTIEVGYLRGSGRRPQLRSFRLDKGAFGVGWDIKMDIGAKALDFRGLHKNTA